MKDDKTHTTSESFRRWSCMVEHVVIVHMKMTEQNSLLSFFICGTVRSRVKVGLLYATFFREFFSL